MKTKKIQEIVYGINPVQELIKAKKRKVSMVYTTDPQPKAFSKILQSLPSYIEVRKVSKQHLENLSGTGDHQGVVALASPLQIRKKFFEPDKNPFLVLLDGVQDPRNLGAIIRSAYCTNASGVLIPQKGSSPLTGTVNKASAGLLERVDIFQAPSTVDCVKELKSAGYNIFISTLDKSASMTETKFLVPFCIVIGSEGTGVSKQILNQGQPVKIPQREADISYNASVAAGILFFYASEQNGLL